MVLLIASEKLKVQVDPKIEQIHEALPHLDCGACGFAGCASYAKGVLENPELIGKRTMLVNSGDKGSVLVIEGSGFYVKKENKKAMAC